jgi:hypothetical protein
MPYRSLHKLQVSVNHEVQSHTRKDLAKLKQTIEKWDTLEIVYEQANLDTQEEREQLKGLEQKVEGTYKKIPQGARRAEITVVEKIGQIAW